ncbi:YlxM family DNA-binding protein [Mycoplasma sp. P36-A1]|uniref:YlxM family DNA-binding protein n=1 Tax=Mycoplasma sp. P36-A1 TaxID=3252900 RepID=UPI003C2D7CDB
MNNIENITRLIALYDIYKELLTSKQQEYFEQYYFEDLSLQEISENFNVSRNAIHRNLQTTQEHLEKYENVLKIQLNQNKLITEFEYLANKYEISKTDKHSMIKIINDK